MSRSIPRLKCHPSHIPCQIKAFNDSGRMPTVKLGRLGRRLPPIQITNPEPGATAANPASSRAAERAESKMEGVGWILNILTECLSQVMTVKIVPSGKNLRFASIWLHEALNPLIFVGVGRAFGM